MQNISSSFLPSELYSNPKQALQAVFILRFVMLSFALAAGLFIFTFISENLLDDGYAGIVLIGALYSFISLLRLKTEKPIRNVEIFIHLMADTVFVVLLVSLSGRTSNPFIYYLLVLVALNALLFEQGWSWFFSFLAILCYSILFYFDINAHLSHSLNEFQLHLFGMWINFVGSALLINFVISTLTRALKDKEKSLALAREENIRNEQMLGLGAIAASTVHALRTPLSTLAVLLSDLKSATPEQEESLIKDFDLLLEQVERCKQTTNKLASLAELPQTQSNETTGELAAFLEEHYLLIHTAIKPYFSLTAFDADLKIVGSILIKQALINLIDNAIEAAKSEVTVVLTTSGEQLIIKITDNGPGFPEQVIEHWGQPFHTQKQHGLGIGIFLANSNIERFGGQVKLLTNSSEGACIEVVLPILANIEQAPVEKS